MLLFFIILGVLALLMGMFITIHFHRFYTVKKLENKSKLLSWFVSAIPTIIFVIFGIRYFLYSMVVALHLVIILLLCDIIWSLVKRAFKIETKRYIAGFCAIVITACYFSYAWINAHNVVKTNYMVNSEKLMQGEKLRIAQITDSHMGTTFNGEKFGEYLKEIVSENPDVVVVTGDFVDERTSYEDMVTACKMLSNINVKYGVYFIFGNHDLHVYGGNPNYTDKQLKDELKKNNVNVLEDETVLIADKFYISGRQDKTVHDRKSTEELLSGIDKSKYVLLLDHQPLEYSEAHNAGADLLLSGHTHGGQMFPLAYISTLVSNNEMVYGIKNLGNTTFIVSSGISEWGLGFRTGAVSEYVIIDVNGAK